jgi:hypothetical protein
VEYAAFPGVGVRRPLGIASQTRIPSPMNTTFLQITGSGGVALDSWLQISTAAPTGLQVMGYGLSGTGAANTQGCYIQVGVGAAGAEVPVGVLYAIGNANGSTVGRPIGSIVIHAGERVALRPISSGTANQGIATSALSVSLQCWRTTQQRQSVPRFYADESAPTLVGSWYQYNFRDVTKATVSSVGTAPVNLYAWSWDPFNQAIFGQGAPGAPAPDLQWYDHTGGVSSWINPVWPAPSTFMIPAGHKLYGSTSGSFNGIFADRPMDATMFDYPGLY